MKKYYPYILICIIVVGLFVPFHFAHAGWFDIIPSFSELIKQLIQIIGVAILTLLSYLTGLAGAALNFIIWYTILQFKTNLDGLTGINTAWDVMKDIMNIFFIFILIYQAIMLIISQENTEKIGRFIVMVVLASILINFSLFFTKVMIDASNVVTVGLYNGMVTNPDASTGLSTTVVNRLGLQKIFDPTVAEPDIGSGKGVGTMFIYILGAGALLLITAFVFLAVTVLFAVRYVTLLLLLMLSPIAFMGMALSFMKDSADMWWKALKSQLIFPPVYMLLVWITLTLLGSPGFVNNYTNITGEVIQSFGSGAAPDATMMGSLLNFFILNGLMVYSLVLSKQISHKGSNYIKEWSGKATAFAGGVVMGGGARIGRNTFGRMGADMANDEKLKERAAEGGVKGSIARMQLAAANKAAESSFDVRSTSGFQKLGGMAGYRKDDFGKFDPKKENFRAIMKTRDDEAKKRMEKFKPNEDVYADAKEKDSKLKKEIDAAKAALNKDNKTFKAEEDKRKEEHFKSAEWTTSEKGRAEVEALAGNEEAKEIEKDMAIMNENVKKFASLDMKKEELELREEMERKRQRAEALQKTAESRAKAIAEGQTARSEWKSDIKLTHERNRDRSETENTDALNQKWQSRVTAQADKFAAKASDSALTARATLARGTNEDGSALTQNDVRWMKMVSSRPKKAAKEAKRMLDEGKNQNGKDLTPQERVAIQRVIDSPTRDTTGRLIMHDVGMSIGTVLNVAGLRSSIPLDENDRARVRRAMMSVPKGKKPKDELEEMIKKYTGNTGEGSKKEEGGGEKKEETTDESGGEGGAPTKTA